MATENKSYIWITTQKEGYHFWKDAPEEVAFLKNIHRHIFHFKVYITTKHNDRELEFFMFKNDIEIMIDNFWVLYNLHSQKDTEGLSCEMMADELYEQVRDIYPNREVIIEVSEDKENGCRKEYPV